MAANPSIQLGTDGNWAIKEDNLLAYKKDGTRFFNKEFDFTRNTTATFVDKNGLIQQSATNTPRIDFKDDTTGHLPLEPQSTNLITYSEDFSEGIWSKNNVTVTNGFTSPSGDLSAYKLQPTQTSSVHLLNIPATSSSVKTYSVFAKQNGYKKFRFNTGSSSNGYTSFDLNTGSVVATGGTFYSSSNIEDYGNGWYKCSMTLSSNAPNNYTLAIEDDNGAVNFLGDGVSSIYIWGAQVEALPYATSYISTSGSTVTRNAEVCNDSGSVQDFNSEEGVLYAEISGVDDGQNRRISISDGTNNNRVVIYFNTSNNLLVLVRVANSTSFSYTFGTDIKQFLKVGLKWKLNDFALWVNGVKVAGDTSGPTFANNILDGISFADGNGTSLPFYGKTKNIKVFKRALSDAELQKLTT